MYQEVITETDTDQLPSQPAQSEAFFAQPAPLYGQSLTRANAHWATSTVPRDGALSNSDVPAGDIHHHATTAGLVGSNDYSDFTSHNAGYETVGAHGGNARSKQRVPPGPVYNLAADSDSTTGQTPTDDPMHILASEHGYLIDNPLYTLASKMDSGQPVYST